MTTAPSLTVVIPTFNRLARLRQVLDGLAEQDVDAPFEVVVVSDGSTDGTDEHLAGGATPVPVTWATQANGGPSSARNHGVDLASGDLILFIDDDVVPTPGLVRRHLEAHAEHGAWTVVIGPMRDPPDHHMSPWIRWEQAMLAKQYDAMESGEYEATPRQFYTGNASLLRRHLVAVGGFDTAFRRAEDVELAHRLSERGLRFTFVPDAVGLHYAERSSESWLGSAHAYGRNDVVFGRDRGQPAVLARVAADFRTRHALVRALTRACAQRPRSAAMVTQVLLRFVGIASHLWVPGLARLSLSGAYNLAYYLGVADELGGPAELRRLLGWRSARQGARAPVSAAEPRPPATELLERGRPEEDRREAVDDSADDDAREQRH